MATFTTSALEYFADHHGVASHDRLIRAGMSDHDLRTMVDSGNLISVLRGAYRHPAVPFDEAARCAALCEAHPGVVISGPTAGRSWSYRRLPRDRRVHAIAPPGTQRLIAPWVVLYRTAAIHEEDIERRDDGISVTSRPRTALDLARVMSPRDLRSVIEQAIHDGSHSIEDMYSVAVDWLSPQRPWLKTFVGLLGQRLAGGPAESHGETDVGDALSAAGIRSLVRQHRVDLPGYGPARFDLAVPSLRWAIEVDLHPTHRETAGRLRDADRDLAAQLIGWRVDRVDDDDYRTIGITVARLLAIYRRLRTASDGVDSGRVAPNTIALDWAG